MDNKKQFYDDISCIRAILVISIVLGHSFAIYIGSNAWPLLDCVFNPTFYKYINPSVISFHLQAFVFIAGFLFASQMTNGRITPTITFVLKKTKRIILPMVVFGLLYIYLFNNEYFYNGQWFQCLCNGPGHLWFLPMLYLCYICTRLLWRA